MKEQKNLYTEYLVWYKELSDRDPEDLTSKEILFLKYFKYIVKTIVRLYDPGLLADMLQEGLRILYESHKRYWSDDFDRTRCDSRGKIVEQNYIFKMIYVKLIQYKYKIKYPITMTNYVFKHHFKGAVGIEMLADDMSQEDFVIESPKELVSDILTFLDRKYKDDIKEDSDEQK